MPKSIISNQNLINFVAEYAYEYIGMSGGEQTTLSDEMAIIAKAVAKADVCRIAVDPYRPRLAFALAEMTEDEKMAYAENKYRRAAKKILWLNSICRERMCCTFIGKRVNPDSLDDIEELVDAFEAAIRFAATGN